MAITFVNYDQEDATGVTFRTFDENVDAAEGNLMLVFLVRTSNTDDGEWTDPADFTQIASKHETVGNDDCQIYLGYKIRGATTGSGYLFDYGGTAAGMAGAMLMYTGVDQTNPLDVTYVEATHYTANNNAAANAPKPITTVTNGAEVIVLQNFTQELTTAGPPSGFTEIVFGPAAVTLANSRHYYIAAKNQAVAGVVTPGVWTHTDADNDADARNFTIALRPATVVSSPKGRMLMSGIG